MEKKYRELPVFWRVLPFMVVLFALGAQPEKGDVSAEQQQAAETASDALPAAEVDGQSITVGLLEKALSAPGPAFRGEPLTEEKRRKFLEKMIDLELMSAEAKRRGYDKNPEVISIYKNQLASMMHKKIASEADEENPSDDVLKKYYDEHYDSYHKPEKVRARHILIKDRSKALKVLQDAQKKKMSRHEFRKIAQELSEDEKTSKLGGDLGYFTKGETSEGATIEIDPKIVDAAFKIKKNGDLFPGLVETDKGYHIIMRTGHRNKLDLAFEEVKDRLVILVRREMRKNRIEEAVENLKKTFPVKVFEENLKYVVIDLSAGPQEPKSQSGFDPDGRAKKINKRANKRLQLPASLNQGN